MSICLESINWSAFTDAGTPGTTTSAPTGTTSTGASEGPRTSRAAGWKILRFLKGHAVCGVRNATLSEKSRCIGFLINFCIFKLLFMDYSGYALYGTGFKK